LSRAQFAAILLAGALLRAVALPGPGTGDVTVFKVWSYHAARHDVADMYGVGGSPLEWRSLEFDGAQAFVVYPPLVLYELGAAGQAYWLWSLHHFPNTAALNVFVKLPGLLAEIGLAWLLFVVVRARLGVTAARWCVTAYWLNPAALINASVLGYLDPQFALPAVGAIVAAASGWPAVAGALVAVAGLTKPQGIFIGPAVLIALWACTSRERRVVATATAAAGGAAVIAVVLAPFVLSGGFPNFVQAMTRLAHHDMLSANACNLWWIVGYVVRVRHSMHDMGTWAAITAPARILGISRMVEIGYPNPLMIGTALTVGTVAWSLWIAGRSTTFDLWLAAALGAFSFHAYATLSAQVHENHLFGAVPLLVLAAAGRPAFRPLCAVVSAIVALNLNLFYGFGSGVGYALPRAMTVVDLTLIVSAINCAALCWHAVLLRRECSTAAGRRQSPAPA
jgi:hypothetical protein